MKKNFLPMIEYTSRIIGTDEFDLVVLSREESDIARALSKKYKPIEKPKEPEILFQLWGIDVHKR